MRTIPGTYNTLLNGDRGGSFTSHEFPWWALTLKTVNSRGGYVTGLGERNNILLLLVCLLSVLGATHFRVESSVEEKQLLLIPEA